MRFFPKRLTDDEYVERHRRSLDRQLRYRWLFVSFQLLIVACHVLLAFKISEGLLDLWKKIELGDANAPFLFGISAGAFVGFVLGLSLSGCLANLAHCLRGFRAESLLVQHYSPREFGKPLAGRRLADHETDH